MNNKFLLTVITQSATTIINMTIIKYTWLSENKLEVYDEENTKIVYLLQSFFVQIKEVD